MRHRKVTARRTHLARGAVLTAALAAGVLAPTGTALAGEDSDVIDVDGVGAVIEDNDGLNELIDVLVSNA